MQRLGENASRRQVFQKVRHRPAPGGVESVAVRTVAVRAAREGIEDPMTLMTRLCVRILTLTGLTARKASEAGAEGGGQEENERGARSGDARAAEYRAERHCGGNKRLLEASRGGERRSRQGEAAVFEPRR